GRCGAPAEESLVPVIAIFIIVFPSLSRGDFAWLRIVSPVLSSRHSGEDVRMFPSASTRGRWFCAYVRCGGSSGRRGHGLRDLGTKAVLRSFFGVENGSAMLADGDARLDAFAARGALAQAHGDVRPFALDAESHRGSA